MPSTAQFQGRWVYLMRHRPSGLLYLGQSKNLDDGYIGSGCAYRYFLYYWRHGVIFKMSRDEKYIEPFRPRLFRANEDGARCIKMKRNLAKFRKRWTYRCEYEIMKEFSENVDELKRRWFDDHQAEQCNQYCLGFSRRHNIVHSKRYLNLRVENGGISAKRLLSEMHLKGNSC